MQRVAFLLNRGQLFLRFGKLRGNFPAAGLRRVALRGKRFNLPLRLLELSGKLLLRFFAGFNSRQMLRLECLGVLARLGKLRRGGTTAQRLIRSFLLERFDPLRRFGHIRGDGIAHALGFIALGDKRSQFLLGIRKLPFFQRIPVRYRALEIRLRLGQFLRQDFALLGKGGNPVREFCFSFLCRLCVALNRCNLREGSRKPVAGFACRGESGFLPAFKLFLARLKGRQPGG